MEELSTSFTTDDDASASQGATIASLEAALMCLDADTEVGRAAGVHYIRAQAEAESTNSSALYALVEAAWPTLRRCVCTGVREVLDVDLSRWRAMGPRVDAYAAMHALVRHTAGTLAVVDAPPGTVPGMYRDAMFWRALLFGLRQDATVRTPALEMLRAVLDAWQVRLAAGWYAAEHAEPASGAAEARQRVARGLSEWETLFDLLGVLQDFPANLALQLHTQIERLVVTVSAQSGAVFTETVVRPDGAAPDVECVRVCMPPESWWRDPNHEALLLPLRTSVARRLAQDATGIDAASLEAGFMSPAFVSCPDAAEGVTLEWAYAPVSRMFKHDHQGIRRAFLATLIGSAESSAARSWAPAIASEQGCVEVSSIEGAYGVSSGAGGEVADIPLLLCMAPWFVASLHHFMGCMATWEAPVSNIDNFGHHFANALAAYVDMLARGDAVYGMATGRYLLPMFVTSTLQTLAARPLAPGFSRRCIQALAVSAARWKRWWRVLAGPARDPPAAAYPVPQLAVEYACIGCTSLARVMHREAMYQRQRELVQLLVLGCHPTMVRFDTWGMMLGVLPASVVYSPAADDATALPPLSRWLALHPSETKEQLRTLLRRAFDAASPAPVAAAAIARVLACVPDAVWTDNEELLGVMAPWVDQLREGACRRAYALELLLALCVVQWPWHPLADAHATVVRALDLLPVLPTLRSPLTDGFEAALRTSIPEDGAPERTPPEVVARVSGHADHAYAAVAWAPQPDSLYTVLGDAPAAAHAHESHGHSSDCSEVGCDVERGVSLVVRAQRPEGAVRVAGHASLVSVLGTEQVAAAVAPWLAASCCQDLALCERAAAAPHDTVLMYSWETGLLVGTDDSPCESIALPWRLRMPSQFLLWHENDARGTPRNPTAIGRPMPETHAVDNMIPPAFIQDPPPFKSLCMLTKEAMTTSTSTTSQHTLPAQWGPCDSHYLLETLFAIAPLSRAPGLTASRRGKHALTKHALRSDPGSALGLRLTTRLCLHHHADGLSRLVNKTQARPAGLHNAHPTLNTLVLNGRRKQIGRKHRNDALHGSKRSAGTLCRDACYVLRFSLCRVDMLLMCAMLRLHHDGHIPVDCKAGQVLSAAISNHSSGRGPSKSVNSCSVP